MTGAVELRITAPRKKLGIEALLAFRDRFSPPLTKK